MYRYFFIASSMIIFLGAFFPTSSQDEPIPGDCIAIIGDSIPHGSATFAIPGHGFAAIQTPPLNVVLQGLLDALDVTGFQVIDRSAPASYLNWYGPESYFQSPQFALLSGDTCTVHVVIPWYNDFDLLKQGDGPTTYIAWLAYLVQSLRVTQPDRIILLADFFPVYPADFMAHVYSEVTPANLALYNEVFYAACASDGVLGAIPNVYCIPAADTIAALEGAHVLQEITRHELSSILYEPLPEAEHIMLEIYWQENPDAPIIGDGVHLNADGQYHLAYAVYLEMSRLGLFAPQLNEREFCLSESKLIEKVQVE